MPKKTMKRKVKKTTARKATKRKPAAKKKKSKKTTGKKKKKKAASAGDIAAETYQGGNPNAEHSEDMPVEDTPFMEMQEEENFTTASDTILNQDNEGAY